MMQTVRATFGGIIFRDLEIIPLVLSPTAARAIQNDRVVFLTEAVQRFDP